MDTGIEHMLTTRKDKELASAFRLVSRNEPSLKLVAAILEPYIKKNGEKLYGDEVLKKDPRSNINIFLILTNSF